MIMTQWKCTVCGYLHDDKHPPEECPVCGTVKFRFILNENPPDNLIEMLKYAYGAESKAYVRNLAYARQADWEGFPEVGRLFRAVAEAERIHATDYLKYMDIVNTHTEQNLQRAFENEIKAHSEGYAPLIKEAIETKREDIAWSFIRARDVEDRHAKLYKQALTAMASDRNVVYHVCQVCGYVFDDTPPDECPVCKAGPGNFQQIN